MKLVGKIMFLIAEEDYKVIGEAKWGLMESHAQFLRKNPVLVPAKIAALRVVIFMIYEWKMKPLSEGLH